MSLDEQRRLELQARVYSRAGADEPRRQRVDPLTGRTVELSDSEWQLLLDRRAGRDAPPPVRTEPRVEGEVPRTFGTEPPATASPAPRRPRVTRAGAALAGFAAAIALFGGWMWVSESTRSAPSVSLTIVPTPTADSAVPTIPESVTFDVFRDPDIAVGVLPWWLMRDFPVQQVAELVPSGGVIRGASIYAAISDNTVTCLVVRLEPNGLNWNCTSTERVLSSGLTMHTAIPANLGSGRDGDGDGVSGDWSATDMLTVEWRTDGTFVVTRISD